MQGRCSQLRGCTWQGDASVEGSRERGYADRRHLWLPTPSPISINRYRTSRGEPKHCRRRIAAEQLLAEDTAIYQTILLNSEVLDLSALACWIASFSFGVRVCWLITRPSLHRHIGRMQPKHHEISFASLTTLVWAIR